LGYLSLANFFGLIFSHVTCGLLFPPHHWMVDTSSFSQVSRGSRKIGLAFASHFHLIVSDTRQKLSLVWRISIAYLLLTYVASISNKSLLFRFTSSLPLLSSSRASRYPHTDTVPKLSYSTHPPPDHPGDIFPEKKRGSRIACWYHTEMMHRLQYCSSDDLTFTKNTTTLIAKVEDSTEQRSEHLPLLNNRR